MTLSRYQSVRPVPIFFIALFLVFPGVLPRAENIAKDFVVDVNGTKLSATDAKARVDARLEALGDIVPAEQIDAYRVHVEKKVHEDFIREVLLQAKVNKAGVEVTEKEIEAVIQTMRENLPPSVQFEDFLKMQGLDDQDYRKILSLELAAHKLPDIRKVSAEDVAAYYEEKKEQMNVPETVRARHILISFGGDDDDASKAEKKAKIEEIRKGLLDGADFGETAKKYSACPSSQKGGDLGAVGRGSMVPSFDRAAVSQEVGESGESVESKFGYHLIEVTEKNEGQERSLENVRDQIEMFLWNRSLSEYVQSLRADAKIQYSDQAENSAGP